MAIQLNLSTSQYGVPFAGAYFRIITASANRTRIADSRHGVTIVTLVDAAGAYPISSFSYLLVYPKMSAGLKRDGLFDFLNWGLVKGQELSAKLNYAPLPLSLVKRILEKVNQK